MLNSIERINLALETPINRIVRDPRFNPFYHTGTISVFLLLIILFTGIYLSLFYPFGFDVAYKTVARVEGNPIGRIIRALHRYASAAALITALLHGWRTFFMDRYRGARWLAWVTGVVMVAAVWLAGITGYWLIWDVRAQVITDSLIRLVQGWPAAMRFLLDNILTPRAESGWFFVLLAEITHVALGLAIIFFFIYHIRRLSRAKINPPRFWAGGLLLLLILAAVFAPAGMLPQADPDHLPGAFPIDIFFLFYLAPGLQNPLFFWGAATMLFIAVGVVPWLVRRKPAPVVKINGPRCTGCTLCAADCPYKALKMVERTDGVHHKYIAMLDPGMCVSCGICIGSCPTLAISLGDQPAEAVWEQVVAQASVRNGKPVSVVFTCERHAFQGGHAVIAPDGSLKMQKTEEADNSIRIIPLTCIGMAHPDLVEKALSAGAGDVLFVGCPPEDCANREGNLWMQQRLERRRLPRLRLDQDGAPLSASSAWAAPNDLWRAIQGKTASTPASTYEDLPSNRLDLRSFAPALALMAIVLVIQLILTNVPYLPYFGQQAVIEITIEHRPGAPIKGSLETDFASSEAQNTRLLVSIDGTPAYDQLIPTQGSGLNLQSIGYTRLPAASGAHQVKVELGNGAERWLVFDEKITLASGEVWRLLLEDAKLNGDPEMGRKLFNDQVFGARAGCTICHSLEPGFDKAGPSLAGVAVRAAQRIPGMSAEEYLRQSIMEPNAYIVEGFASGQMPQTFGKLITESQIQDIVAFLLTLK